LFEAYASEYQNSYLNEKSETAKLLKVIDKKDLQVAEAHHAVAQVTKVLESKEAQVKALMESKERQEIMNELVAPLANTQKAIMIELLESVQTAKLRNSFDKYIPAVIAGEAPQKKKALVEAKEVTGNKETHSVGSSEHESNIFNMRRLAGIKH